MIFVITFTTIGAVESYWTERLKIEGQIKTGNWKACIRIRKILYGAYYNYDPETGTYEGPQEQVAIAANIPTYFKMIIEVVNCGGIDLTDVIVTDTIKNTVAPISWFPDKGSVEWIPFPIDYSTFHFDDLVWSIGNLGDGKSVKLVIWIQTLPNNAKEPKFEPTSGDEFDEQNIEINGGGEEEDGATVKAYAKSKLLTATTEGIIIQIIGDGVEDGYGIIDTELPYYTEWAKDSKNIY